MKMEFLHESSSENQIGTKNRNFDLSSLVTSNQLEPIHAQKAWAETIFEH